MIEQNTSLSPRAQNKKGGPCGPPFILTQRFAHQYLSTTVRNVNSTSVSISARPSSNIVKMRPPAPGLRAVPSHAAAIARPSPSAPPSAAIPTANEPIAGKNQEFPVLWSPAPAPVAPGVWAIAVATVMRVNSADSTNSLNLIIIFLLEV